MGTSQVSAGQLEVLVLGAGPAYSDIPGDLGSGFLVRSANRAIVLDLGQGTFNPLAVAIEPSSLDGVVISHLHPDHFIDLIPLRHYLCRMEFQPTRRLRVIAPVGLDRRLDDVYDQPGFAKAAFDMEIATAGRRIVGPFDLETRRVRHAGESCAIRVSLEGVPGPGIVYSGDVADPADLRPLIRRGDLLLCEATFGPGPVPESMPHLDSPTVGRLARETEAGHVVLVHLRMGCDRAATFEAARREFAGPLSIARPRETFQA